MQSLLGCLDCNGPDMGEEYLLVRPRERFDRELQWQPLHSFYIPGRLVCRATNCPHAPELHDLDLATGRIGH